MKEAIEALKRLDVVDEKVRMIRIEK